jgi:hypothetical protein
MDESTVRKRLINLGKVVIIAGAFALQIPTASDALEVVDTALIVSVDISNSVDAEGYRLQMDGIANALEDPSVIDAITGGPNGNILFTMITWAADTRIAVPWTVIANKTDAKSVAQRVRTMPRNWAGGAYTCMARMLEYVDSIVVAQKPYRALRTVLDVSGDGTDNCADEVPTQSQRDAIVAKGVVVNGLPIRTRDLPGHDITISGKPILGDVAPQDWDALLDWYRNNVKGGPGSFILPADGYKDFGRAIRQKFVIEISGIPISSQLPQIGQPASTKER